MECGDVTPRQGALVVLGCVYLGRVCYSQLDKLKGTCGSRGLSSWIR